MAEEYNHKVNIDDFLGLDLTSNDLKRQDNFLTGGKNFDVDDNGDLVTRRGYRQLEAAVAGQTGRAVQSANFFGLGRSVANKVEGDITAEMLTIFSDGAYRVKTYQMLVTTSATRRFIVYFDGAWFMKVTSEDRLTTYYDAQLTGTFLTLQTALQAVSGVSSVTFSAGFPTSDVSEHLLQQDRLCGPSQTLEFYKYKQEALSIGTTDPGDTFVGNAICSSTAINNVVMFTDKDGLIWKYDGVAYYRAGLPKPTFTVGNDPTTAGAYLGAGSYTWKMRLVHRDNGGNFVYGPLSDPKTASISASNNATITIPFSTFMGTGTKYKQRHALTVAPAAAGLTAGVPFNIAVTNNSLKVDDIACFATHLFGSEEVFSGNFNTLSSNSIGFARVSASTPTSITIVPTKNSAVSKLTAINAGIYMEIYRTKEKAVDPGQTNFIAVGVVSAIPSGTGIYYDRWVDVGPPLFHNDRTSNLVLGNVSADAGVMSPNCKYLTNFKGRLIAAGDFIDPNAVNFSEPGFPENFPTATNSFLTDTEFGDEVTGVSGNQDALLVFKDATVHRVAGDLSSSFSVDRIYTGIGCVSHNSIAEIGEQRTVFLTQKGLYQVIRSSAVMPLMPIQGISGEFIDRLAGHFDLRHSSTIAEADDSGFVKTDIKYLIDIAQASTFSDQNKYMLVIPKAQDLPLDFTDVANIDFCEVIIFDYKRGYYSIWDKMSAFGGFRQLKASNYDNKKTLFFNKIEGTTSKIHALSNTYLEDDFIDSTSPIVTTLNFNWMHLGAPDVLKKFLRGNMWVIGASPSTMTVTSESDWQAGNVSTVVDLENNGEANLKFKFLEQRARSMRLSVSHSDIGKQMRLSGFTLEVAAPYKQRVKE